MARVMGRIYTKGQVVPFNMLETSRQNKVKKFVFAFSNAPLGKAELPVNEKTVPEPFIFPWSKQFSIFFSDLRIYE